MKRIILLLISVSLLLSSVSCFATEVTTVDKTILYVSLDGNDKNPGTLEKPLGSLEGARDKLRTMKKDGSIGKDGAVVYIRGGEYNILKSFVLEKEDSGTKDAPITYRAYNDEKVSFVGGSVIPYSAFKKTTDKKILDQIIEEDAKDKIVQINLRDFGYTGPVTYHAEKWVDGGQGEMEWRPEPVLTTPVQLFIGDTQMHLVRYPNDENEWIGMKQLIKLCQDSDSWLERYYTAHDWIPPEERDPTDQLIFVPEGDRYLLWPEDGGDAVLGGRWGVSWATNYAFFTVDKEKGQIATKHPLMYTRNGTAAGKSTFFFTNHICELDVPYEYYTTEDGTFYCILPEEAKTERIFLSVISEPMFILKSGCEYITFRGLDFNRAKNRCVSMEPGSANNLVYDCNVDNNTGIYIKGKNNGVKNSQLHAATTTLTDGDVEKLIPAGNYVENCDITPGDNYEGNAYAVLIDQGVGNRISYNDIHDSPVVVAGVFGKKHIFEYNDIYDVCREISDAGAVYGTGISKGGVADRGNIWRYNYFHDIASSSIIEHGVCGIYNDDCSSGSLILGNIFENIDNGKGWGTHLGGSSDTIIDNNIFINCAAAGQFSERASWPTVAYPENSIIISNLERYNHGYFRNEWWREEFPELYERYNVIDPATFAQAWNTRSTNNILWNTGPNLVADSFKYFVEEGNYTTDTDPGFVDAENGNYMLREDSPVFKTTDFKQIPVTRIGRYNERAVERIKDAVVLKDDSPYAFLGGEQTLIGDDESVTPVYVGDSVYVPLRFISEGLGAEVEWDENTNSASIITKEGKAVTLTLNSFDAVKDGNNVTLEQAPILYLDKTYIPLRAFSELAEYIVYWNDCGLICVSNDERFNEEADLNIITFLADELNVY